MADVDISEVSRHLAANNPSFDEGRLGRISDDQLGRQCDCLGFNGSEDHGDDRPNPFLSGLFAGGEAVGLRRSEPAIVEADDRDLFGDAEAEFSSCDNKGGASSGQN